MLLSLIAAVIFLLGVRFIITEKRCTIIAKRSVYPCIKFNVFYSLRAQPLFSRPILVRPLIFVSYFLFIGLQKRRMFSAQSQCYLVTAYLSQAHQPYDPFSLSRRSVLNSLYRFRQFKLNSCL